MSLRCTQSGHTETHYGIHSQCLIWLSQEEYFRALAKSPAVLGMRKMSKDGKIIYTSPELKKIDQILDKARSGLAHLESLWNVSDALNGRYPKLIFLNSKIRLAMSESAYTVTLSHTMNTSFLYLSWFNRD
jgi:hypothetical protein